MIKICNLKFSYKNEPIFNDFSVEIPDYSKVVLVGESGSGKTTFLNLLCGFEIAEKGEIYYDDLLLNQQNIHFVRQQIAWLPQNVNLPFEDIQEMFFSVYNLKSNKKLKPSNDKVKEIFDIFSIEIELLTKKNDEISGGQKQRVMLASVISTKKKYIFLDEPTSSLDEVNTEKIVNYLLNEIKSTILIATHDKKFIEKADIVLSFPQN